MTDRRAGPKQGPYVSKVLDDYRNQDGTWRKKRSDAGKAEAITEEGQVIAVGYPTATCRVRVPHEPMKGETRSSMRQRP
jgi:hypothetical protein